MLSWEKLIPAHRNFHPDSQDIRVFVCPGRINLIGEHIDYNGGRVLPAAIDREIHLCVSPNKRDSFRFASLDFNGIGEIPLGDLRTIGVPHDEWWLYPYGAIRLMDEKWDAGFDFSYYSTIPVGAGVSSSAAITTVTLFALHTFQNHRINTLDLARLGQRVEREIVGVSCGIMDQFAVIHGRKNQAMLLDTRDLTCQYVGIDSSIAHFVLINSGIRHSLKESGYNNRRKECESALAIIKSYGENINALCDLSLARLKDIAGNLPFVEARRAFHAVSENERTLAFYRALKEYDFIKAGELLYESHNSLRDHFEVSTPEIDRIVEWTGGIDGVYGARMMGGGFGGCIIAMVAVYAVEGFIETMTRKFEGAFGRKPEVYPCTIEDGVREIKGGSSFHPQ